VLLKKKDTTVLNVRRASIDQAEVRPDKSTSLSQAGNFQNELTIGTIGTAST
jgi:hypothetical protein